MLIARVRHHWPDVWRDPSYRTRDGIIPFPLFWLYAGALGASLAFERVQLARGVGHAIGMAFAKKDDGLSDSLRADLVAAYLARPHQ